MMNTPLKGDVEILGNIFQKGLWARSLFKVPLRLAKLEGAPQNRDEIFKDPIIRVEFFEDLPKLFPGGKLK
jgi:hypothetical protein